jgi:phospholipid-binding lipoprotein MlaA
MHMLRNNIKKAGVLALAAAASLMVSACNPTPDAEDNDPIEGFNRGVFTFNRAVDTVVLRPVAVAYRGVMPERGRLMVTNAVNNIYEPVVFANSVLQLDPENSFTSLWRFLLNPTVGVGGAFDVASELGLKGHDTDLGQTFAVYGAGEGPYLVLPLIGPSNVRDTFGRAGDMLMNPVTYADAEVSYSVWGVTLLDRRTSNIKVIDDLYSSSLDPYTTFRSAYLQHRRADIKATKAARSKAIAKAMAADAAPLPVDAPVKPAKKIKKAKPAAEAPAPAKVQ